MRQKSIAKKSSAEQVVRDIRRRTRKRYGSEETIRIALDGLRGDEGHRKWRTSGDGPLAQQQS